MDPGHCLLAPPYHHRAWLGASTPPPPTEASLPFPAFESLSLCANLGRLSWQRPHQHTLSDPFRGMEVKWGGEFWGFLSCPLEGTPRVGATPPSSPSSWVSISQPGKLRDWLVVSRGGKVGYRGAPRGQT